MRAPKLAATFAALSLAPAAGGANPVTTLALPAPVAQYPPAEPSSLVAGTGGTVWAAIESDTTHGVVHLGPNGILTRVRAASTVHGLATMGDGSLWYTTEASTAVGRVGPDGTATECPTGPPRD